MPGIRIDVDTSRGISSLTDFRRSLEQTGATAVLSDRELAKLADRFRDKLSADVTAKQVEQTRKQIEQIGKAAGLSERELAKLHKTMGTAGSVSSSTSTAAAATASSFSGLGGIVAGLATRLLAFLGIYKLVKESISYASDAIQTGARYQTLGVTIEKLGENMGYTNSQMHAFDEGMQKTGISMIESREALSKMTLAGIDLSKSIQLANIAQGSAIVTGKSTGEALERIVQGIVTGQTRLLRNQGIMVSIEQAQKKYADSLGTTQDALTETEKAQAALNAVLEFGQRTSALYDAAMGTAGKQITSFKRYILDLKTVIGESFLDSFTTTVFDSADAIKKLKEIMTTPEAKDAISSLSSSVFGLASTIIQAIPNAVQKIVDLVNALRNLRTALPENFGDLGSWVVKAYDTTSGFSDSLREGMLNAKIDNATMLMNSTSDEDAKRAYSQKIDYYNDQLKKLKENANNVGSSLSKTVLSDSAIEHLRAESDALALANKKLIEQTDILNAANIIRDKNKPNLPVEVRRRDAFNVYQADTSKIDRAIGVEKESGNAQEVSRLYETKAAAANTYKKALESIDKELDKGKTGAKSAERYESRTDTQLQQYQDMVDQLKAQLEGDTLESKLSGIEKKYAGLVGSINTGMIGAKGATEGAKAAIDKLGEAKALEIAKAKIDAWKKSMQDASGMLSKIGQLTGNPEALYSSAMAQNQLWSYDQQNRVNSIKDPSEREKQQAELVKVNALLEVDARKSAYENIKSFTKQYWSAEKERIQEHLDEVKGSASDELAYKMYAAQQWDEYNKTKLDSQVQYATSASQMFAAKWALAFGSYKTGLGQARVAWEANASNIIVLNQDLISSVSSGFGDFFKKMAKGTASISNLWETMCDRMLDAVGNFVDKTINDQLSRLLSSLGGGSGGGLFSGLFSWLSGGGSSSPLMSSSAYTSMYLAHGGAFTGSYLPANTIANSPTYFPLATAGCREFATGAGVYGEAGPEAIMPLKRLSNGNLGVQSTKEPSSQQPNITFKIENRTGQDIKMSTSKTEKNQDGLVATMILDLVSRNVGGLRSGLQSSMGVR